LVAGRRVCELGAGAGLVSIIAALAGAAQVVATDYPDPEVIENLEQNIRLHVPKLSRATDLPQPAVKVIPYRWGSSPVLLRQQAGVQSFAVILMADLLSYHQAHPALLQSVKALLALPEDDPAAVALVAFAHHRPHVADRDRAFLDLVNADGALIAEPWLPPVQMEPMFPEDAGAATVRGCVHRWRLRWRPFASGDTSKETHGFNDGASLS
jgi:nicotinamide N-methyltransferase